MTQMMKTDAILPQYQTNRHTEYVQEPFRERKTKSILRNVNIDPPGNDLRVSTFSGDYELRDGWHIYRIEVRANSLQLYDNGIPLGGGMSSQQTSYLSAGPLSLHARQLVLQVSQLRLLSL
jgi:hypothetical protein